MREAIERVTGIPKDIWDEGAQSGALVHRATPRVNDNKPKPAKRKGKPARTAKNGSRAAAAQPPKTIHAPRPRSVRQGGKQAEAAAR